MCNEEKFKASNGWLDNFKKRHNLRQYNIHGEAGSAPIQDLDSMRGRLRQTLRDYDPKDIFNCDETGLFWKMKLSHTISNGPVVGTKQSKDCVTILLTCNSTGTEKLRPLFIHKYENSRVLKNISKNSLPVNYYWNKKSWMQVSIWNDYLKKLDSHMRVQNRNILLLVDNAPTHALYENTNLTNIVIEHLPPNTTSHLQPCDQGIINSFKVRSKLYLFTEIVSNLTLIFLFSLNIESCICVIRLKLLIILMNMELNLMKLILKNVSNMFHVHGITLQILQSKIVG